MSNNMKVEFTITVLNTFYCLEYMVDQIVLPRNMFTDVGNYENTFTDDGTMRTCLQM